MPMYKDFGRYIGEYTWAQLFALTGMADGAEAVVTNIPSGGRRSRWYYDATAGRWRVYSPTLIAENTTVITGLAQTADQYLGGLSVPAGIMQGAVMSYRIGFGKTGTTDAFGTTNFRVGTAGSVADASFASPSGILTAAQRSVGVEMFFRLASTTSLEKLGSGLGAPSGFSGAVIGNVPNPATTVPNVTTNALSVGVSTTMGGSTNQPQLSYQGLFLHP